MCAYCEQEKEVTQSLFYAVNLKDNFLEVWAKNEEVRGRILSLEIAYCPFCGEKLP